MGDNELSYCELRNKEVVNATDGKRMGRIVDMLFSRDDGRISGIVVPLARRGLFTKNQDVFIPWRCIQKIGEDVILVCLITEPDGRIICADEPPKPPHPPKPPRPPKDCRNDSRCDDRCDSRFGDRCDCPPEQSGRPDCDGRCEKCMLFDCAHRWTQMN